MISGSVSQQVAHGKKKITKMHKNLVKLFCCQYPVINYLRAKMKGLMTEADLQRKDGSCETIGVIILLSPKAAVITT